MELSVVIFLEHVSQKIAFYLSLFRSRRVQPCWTLALLINSLRPMLNLDLGTDPMLSARWTCEGYLTFGKSNSILYCIVGGDAVWSLSSRWPQIPCLGDLPWRIYVPFESIKTWRCFPHCEAGLHGFNLNIYCSYSRWLSLLLLDLARNESVYLDDKQSSIGLGWTRRRPTGLHPCDKYSQWINKLNQEPDFNTYLEEKNGKQGILH